jgi:L-threonylcarbamoyladenylate synthase
VLHPVFAAIVSHFGKPLAAPSANRFGRISPTTAAHVTTELGGRISLIIDGGPTQHGVESTIVSVEGVSLRLLRAGPVTTEELKQFARLVVAEPTARSEREVKVEAPGQLPSITRRKRS